MTFAAFLLRRQHGLDRLFLVQQPSQIHLPPLECDVRLDSFPVEVTAASDVEVVSPRQLQIKRGLLWRMAWVKAFNGFQAAVL